MKNNIIYMLSFILGIMFLLFTSLPTFKFITNINLISLLANDTINNISISIGAGFITSSIIAYFIEKSNRQVRKKAENDMKRIFLIEILELIKQYQSLELPLERLEFIIHSYYIAKTISTYERYIPIGINFFSTDEFKQIDNFYWQTNYLSEFIRKPIFVDNYLKYRNVFDMALTLRFENGPYSEENRLQKISIAIENPVDLETSQYIGEFIIIYKRYQQLIDEFYKSYIYLLD